MEFEQARILFRFKTRKFKKKKKKMDRQMGTKTLLNDNLVENVREKRILRYVVVGRTGLNCAPRELSFNSKNSGDR